MRFTRNKQLVFVLILVVGAVVVWLFSRNDSPPIRINADTSIKTTRVAPSNFQYPSGWTEAKQIPIADSRAGVIAEAKHNNPTASLVLSSVPGSLTSGTSINKLASQTVDKLKTESIDFSLLSSSIVNIGGNKAIDIVFSSSSGGQIYTENQFIVPTNQTTYFLTLSVQQTAYPKLSSTVEQLPTSLASYLK